MNKIKYLISIFILVIICFAGVYIYSTRTSSNNTQTILRVDQKYYNVGDIINIQFNNATNISTTSVQLVFIDGPTPMIVKNGLTPGISYNFQFQIPTNVCGEDACETVEAGTYKVTTEIYSKDIFSLSCIDSLYCTYPKSYILTSGQSDDFTINTVR